MRKKKRPCVKLAALIDEKFRTRHDFCIKADIVDPVLSRYLADRDLMHAASYARVERFADLLGVANPRDLFDPVEEETTGEGADDE